MGPGKEGGELSQTVQGPRPDLRGQGSGWEGPLEMGVHTLPGPHTPGTSLEETHPGRWETGPGWRGRNALKTYGPGRL